MLALAYRLIRDERLFGRGDLVLCACSGGADSLALLDALALLQRRVGHRVAAVGVDHGLRPAAAAELDLGAKLAARHGVPFERMGLCVAAGAGLQARAREARHLALQSAALRLGAAAIATGHTADDRAETLLMRLLRGAGPRGLAVLPARAPAPVTAPGETTPGRRIDLVRPLLRARRSDVLAHLGRRGLGFAEDPSNADRRFLRVRVRRELVPLLEELSPGVVAHLCALADMLGQDPAGRPAAAALVALGRAQRLQIERQHRLGRRGARVRLPGGRDLVVRFIFAPTPGHPA
ncbi:MAG: tRNA lysidine(34) synthetase TilS [Deltaproteobacteria bacterium]|nr:tRNA lysidine(34) synthetase TilS [Deltaproteobacteria bacterium]